ncbi:hypothetical protein JYB64_21145, partial [Algoriphagus aestuarii]|nr:hypothetical protein [Algoriphagus aestuarii]
MKKILFTLILAFGFLRYGLSQTTTENYVMSHKYRTATTSSANPLSQPVTSISTAIQYVDGLGRPIQTIQRKGTINGKDLIVPIQYDLFGRTEKEYLPYYDGAASQDGSFRNNAVNDHTSLTTSIYGDTYGYSETLFEASPLNRPEKQAAPGSAWRLGSTKEVKFSRRPNKLEDDVRIWTLDSNGLPVTSSSYPANELWVEITMDEDNIQTVQYTDKLG